MEKFKTTLRSTGAPVTVLGPISTDEDRAQLRADTDFHRETVALLTYPSKTLAFWGEEPPKVYNIPDGSYLMKGEADDFRLVLNYDLLDRLVRIEQGVTL